MPITPGTRIGSYEVTSPLGEGGMGVVFRARDTKLQRDVAIKLLPDDFAGNPDRLMRFKREAQVLASLNHPHIAQIYGFEESGNTRCIVMELVEGETLAQRIAAGPIPIKDALHIAGQIAEALETAHDRGVIHRDLKPANIKVTPDGQVKVLDFGLAKPLQEEQDTTVSNSPTMMTASMPGVILGTPSYLSPEQARGKTIDKRTDIWSFGCVLYEMLTGRQAFSGETLPDIMAAILSRDVKWESLPEETPVKIRELLARCLQKDLRRRLRDAGDARLEIEDAAAAPASSAPIESAPGQAAKRSPIALILAAVMVVLLIVAVLLAINRLPQPMWSGARLGGPNLAMEPRLSPDGRLIAFIALVDGSNQVCVMNPESGDWTVLTHDKTRGYLSNVSWSKDSTKIYYGRIDGVPRGIFTVPALGGTERLVLDDAESPEVLRDGSLLVYRLNPNGLPQMYRFWPETGRIDDYPALLFNGDWSTTPAFKDGKEAVFYGKPAGEQGAKNDLYAIDLDSKKVRHLETHLDFQNFPIFAIAPDDQSLLVKAESGDLHEIFSVPRKGGNPRPLFSSTDDFMGIDVGADGSIYMDQFSRPFEILRFASPGAAAERIVNIDAPIADIAPPALPDGKIMVQSVAGGKARLLMGKPGSEPMPFLQTSEETAGPVALVGTDELAFFIGNHPSHKSLAIASITDGRILRRLTKVNDTDIGNLAASPDGKTLYYTSNNALWSVPADDGEPRMIRPSTEVVAMDTHGKYAIAEYLAKDGVRLARFPLDGQPETPLSFPGVRLAFTLTPNAVRADGAIISPLAVGAFNWAAGILHPDTGKVERLPIDAYFDVHQAGFLPDGRIQIAGYGFNAALWRFKPRP